MKKLYIFLIICMGILVYLYFSSKNPIGSIRVKNELLKDKVLSELGIANDCTFFAGTFFGDNPHRPYFSCTTIDRHSLSENKIEINRMEKILFDNGWIYSGPKIADIVTKTYTKGDLIINIQPYSWEQGTEGLGSRLIINYSENFSR